jgi:hypothetical protein
MNNNHKKSGCGFEEELVSYIYGETDAASKAKFESHLAACANCADELEAFSGVHFAIDDWKAAEFAAIETPAIEIPYPAAREISETKESWLSAVWRDLFSLSARALSLTAASLAVLAVAFGAIFFLIESNGGNELAESNKTTKPAAVPTVEKTPEPANTNPNVPPRAETTDPKTPATPEIVRQPETKSTRAVKVTDRQRAPQKAENTPKNNEPKRANKTPRIKSPEMPDEDEDDTLRLAELFEEIDTRD